MIYPCTWLIFYINECVLVIFNQNNFSPLLAISFLPFSDDVFTGMKVVQPVNHKTTTIQSTPDGQYQVPDCFFFSGSLFTCIYVTIRKKRLSQLPFH